MKTITTSLNFSFFFKIFAYFILIVSTFEILIKSLKSFYCFHFLILFLILVPCLCTFGISLPCAGSGCAGYGLSPLPTSVFCLSFPCPYGKWVLFIEIKSFESLIKHTSWHHCRICGQSQNRMPFFHTVPRQAMYFRFLQPGRSRHPPCR